MPGRDPERLSPRDREILKDVIRTFVTTGEPVSSRTLSKSDRHGLSSASIRNVMADLEEAGYLRQPHTSAGRVPTGVGYHFYIEELMRQRSVSPRDRRYISEHLRKSQGSTEERMAAASQLLSELSRQVGVVMVPALAETTLRAVDFVPLSGRKVLCVVVSESGFVDSKLVELDEAVPREELVRAANYLTRNFSGSTMNEIRDRLVLMMDHEREQMDELLGLVVRLAREGLHAATGPEVLVDGAPGLLAQPELGDLERVRRVFDAFNDKARLVRLLNACISGAGVRVWIEEDSELTSELDFSLVATPYRVQDRVLGSLGIMGPSRMDYERVIPLVEYLAAALGDALETTFEG